MPGALSFRKIMKAVRNDDRFEFREAAGSHIMVKGPDRSSMTLYHNHGGKDAYPPGTCCKIRKWFLKFGVSLIFFAMMFCMYRAFFPAVTL